MSRPSKKPVEEKHIREMFIHMFLDLASTLVGMAIGFSVIFATELGLRGIFMFIWVSVILLLCWWEYLCVRIRYVPTTMGFPLLDIAFLIAISFFPCAMYGMASETLSWPVWVVYFVVGLYLVIWSVWMHQILQTFPEKIAEYGDERSLKAHRQVFLEASIISFTALALSIICPWLPGYVYTFLWILNGAWIPLRLHLCFHLRPPKV